MVAFASPAEAARSDHSLTMGDGVTLASTLYTPDGAAPPAGRPAVLVLHGLGGTRHDVKEIAESHLLPSGYAVLAIDARGHGESGGQSSLGSTREVADSAAAIAWLRARPGIDDARIGAIGFSLGGAVLWKLLTAPGARLAAAVPIATWTSLWDALAPQGLPKAGTLTHIRNLLPPGRWDPAVDSLTEEFARSRSVRNDLEKIRTPVLMVQSRRDAAFDLDQALTAFGRLRSPKRLYLAGDSPAERTHYLTQARLWLDRYLKGDRNGVDGPARIEVGRDPWTGRTELYPRSPARRVLRLRFRGRATIESGGGATRWTEPTRRLNETFGAPLVAVNVASTTQWPHVVAVLSALTPGGQEIVVSQGGAPTPTLSERPRLVTIRLLSQATTIPRGSRLRLTIAGSSTAQDPANLLYPLTVPAGARVTIGEARVVLPVLKRPISRL